MTLTEKQRYIIRHSLGLNHRKIPYRNYYCACIANCDALEELVALGAMERGPVINNGNDRYYSVTDAGRRALEERE